MTNEPDEKFFELLEVGNRHGKMTAYVDRVYQLLYLSVRAQDALLTVSPRCNVRAEGGNGPCEIAHRVIKLVDEMITVKERSNHQMSD